MENVKAVERREILMTKSGLGSEDVYEPTRVGPCHRRRTPGCTDQDIYAAKPRETPPAKSAYAINAGGGGDGRRCVACAGTQRQDPDRPPMQADAMGLLSGDVWRESLINAVPSWGRVTALWFLIAGSEQVVLGA